jgi:hypothetical protein
MKYIFIFAAALFITTCTIQTRKYRQQAGQTPDKLDSFNNELQAGRGQLDSMRVRLNAEIVRLKMSINTDKCAGQTDTIQAIQADMKPDTIPDFKPDIQTDILPDTTDIFNRQPDCHNIK